MLTLAPEAARDQNPPFGARMGNANPHKALCCHSTASSRQAAREDGALVIEVITGAHILDRSAAPTPSQQGEVTQPEPTGNAASRPRKGRSSDFPRRGPTAQPGVSQSRATFP